MVVKIDKSFEKDVKKITSKSTLNKIIEVYDNATAAKSVADIKGLKKLTGFKTYYRIRIGDYRAGVRIVSDTIYFERILLRKDIYREYP